MRRLWRPVDAIGYWVVNEFRSKYQLRMGVLLLLASLPFYPYMLFSNEPPVVYFLSVLAVTLTGLGMLVSLQVLVKQEEAEQGATPDRQEDTVEGRRTSRGPE